jgi:hypothetical protein
LVAAQDFYGSLDDLTVGSLARDAGEWALSAVVPTRSTDGQYEVATFAGGCFWGTEARAMDGRRQRRSRVRPV